MKKLVVLGKNVVATVIMTVIISCADNDIDNQTPSVVVDPTNFPTNELVDNSFNPGDNFYYYCNNNWIKNHPLSGNQESRMYCFDEKYSGDAFKKVLLTCNDPVISKLMSDAAKCDTTDATIALLQKKTLAQLAEIDKLTSLDEIIQKAGELVMLGYKPGIQLALYAVEGEIQSAVAIEIPDAATTRQWQQMTGCTDAEAKALSERCDSIAKAWQPRIGVKPRRTPYTKDVQGRVMLAKAIGVPTSKLVYGDNDLDEFMESTVVEKEKECWKLMLRQAIVAYNHRWTYAKKEDVAAYLYDDGFHPFLYRVAKLYSETYKDKIMKQFVADMVEEIRTAFIELLNENEWLSATTRQTALQKAKAMKVFCGYPDTWNEKYLGSVPSGMSLLEDMEQAGKEWADLVKSTISESPSEDALWYCLSQIGVPPYCLNACYIADANYLDMFMPMLLPSVCRRDVPDSYNYGMVGAIAGHEFGHGFDTNCVKHGVRGEWVDWWTTADMSHFEGITKQLADVNSKYQPLSEKKPYLYSNGDQTSGEDVADLSGLNTALRAMINHYKKNGATEAEILQAKQEFFLAYANSMAGCFSDDNILERVKHDVHSMAELRVNGIVRHIDEWYEVYDIKPTDKLYLAPENRIKIWNK